VAADGRVSWRSPGWLLTRHSWILCSLRRTTPGFSESHGVVGFDGVEEWRRWPMLATSLDFP